MKGVKVPLPENLPKIGSVYKHYKGDSYKVVEVALHSNENIWMIIYQPLYDDADAHLFTRPLSEWDDEVEWEGQKVKRFTLI